MPGKPTPDNSEIAAAAKAAADAHAASAQEQANAHRANRIALAKTRLAEFFDVHLNPTTLAYTYVGTDESGSVVADDGMAAVAVKPDDTVWHVTQGDDGEWTNTGRQVESLVELADALEVD